MTAWINRLSRVTTVPLLLRGLIFVTVWLGLWLALPAQVASVRAALVLAVVALVPALVPGTRAVDVAMLAIVALWVASTLFAGNTAEPVTTFLTAAALYLTHSAAALAAVLPYDSVVDGQVALRWAARSGLVLAGAALLAALIVALAPVAGRNPSALGLLIGLGAVVGLIALIARRP